MLSSFPYAPHFRSSRDAHLGALDQRRAEGALTYEGAIWVEGSPTTEETTYWLGLVIDTTVPFIGNSSQRTHGMLSNVGDRNIVDSVDYIASGIWKDDAGKGKVGAVMIQEEQIFTARDVRGSVDLPPTLLSRSRMSFLTPPNNPAAIT